MNPSRGKAPAEIQASPERSPEFRDGFPTVLRRDDWFTAVMLPVGAMTGVILLFALWTTDRLLIPGYSANHGTGDVILFGAVIGSTSIIGPAVWSAVFLLTFLLVGGTLGLLTGKSLGRLAHWRT
jgi:hypothetical protein